jgi:hypothetical protein
VFSGLSPLVIEDVADQDEVIVVRVRRVRCPALGCPVQTFREQVPGVLDRCQRRTVRLAGQAGAVQAGDRWHLWQCAARRWLT